MYLPHSLDINQLIHFLFFLFPQSSAFTATDYIMIVSLVLAVILLFGVIIFLYVKVFQCKIYL